MNSKPQVMDLNLKLYTGQCLTIAETERTEAPITIAVDRHLPLRMLPQGFVEVKKDFEYGGVLRASDTSTANTKRITMFVLFNIIEAYSIYNYIPKTTINYARIITHSGHIYEVKIGTPGGKWINGKFYAYPA